MKYSVRLTADAEHDLQEIDDYISEYDSPAKALLVIVAIERAIASLSQSPGRGAHVVEEEAHGSRIHREIFFKPYRIIHRVIDKEVVVKLIGDARRNMRELLRRRLEEA